MDVPQMHRKIVFSEATESFF